MVNYKEMYNNHPVIWWLFLLYKIGFVIMCIYFLIQMRKDK